MEVPGCDECHCRDLAPAAARHQVSSVPIPAGRGGTGRTIGTTYARGRTGRAVMCGDGLAVMADMEGSFLVLLAASPVARLPSGRLAVMGTFASRAGGLLGS